ncbi:MAG: hypothetical protein ACRDMV_19115 [Streptosporangiales bacterium]
MSVAVLVELHDGRRVGGHVRTWQRIAELAAGRGDELDLTVYVLGAHGRVTSFGSNAGFVSLAPVLSTRPLGRWLGRAYFRQLAAGVLPARLARCVVDGLGTDRLVAAAMRRHRDRQLRRCSRELASNDADRGHAARLVGPERVARLRLARTYGVPLDKPVVLFTGRVDGSKDVLTVARAARLLGERTHLLVAREGADVPAIHTLLPTWRSAARERLGHLGPGVRPYGSNAVGRRSADAAPGRAGTG